MNKEEIERLIKKELVKYHNENISTRFNQLEETMDTKCSDYDVDQKMSEYKSNLDDVISRVDYLDQLYIEESIIEIKSEIRNLESEISDVRSSSNDYDFECRIDELESQSASLDTRIDKLESQSENLDTRIDELESKITTLEASIE